MAKLAITGLCIRWTALNGARTFSIGGPVVYAALGARLFGVEPTLSFRLGADTSQREMAFIERLGSHASEVEQVKLPNLLWRGSTILDHANAGTVVGEPTSMTAACLPDSAGWLAVANLDPGIILPAVNSWTGPVAVDCYEPWIRFRPRSSLALVNRANVLFLTEREFAAFPKDAQASILNTKDKFVVLKMGSRGICLYHNNVERHLPAPTPLVVRSDLGAGDLLLGLLSSHLAKLPYGSLSVDELAEGYFMARQWIAELLEASHPTQFLARHEFFT